MRTYLAILAVMFVTCGLAFKAGQRSQKHKNFDAEGYSAEWGCLTGGTRACRMIANEDGMYGCMEYMRTTYCPEAAAAFKKFMSQSY